MRPLIYNGRAAHSVTPFKDLHHLPLQLFRTYVTLRGIFNFVYVTFTFLKWTLIVAKFTGNLLLQFTRIMINKGIQQIWVLKI